MTRNELVDWIKRQLGCGMVNVEVTDQMVCDAINMARNKYIKWAVGNATQEVYFTLLLEANKWLYDLPQGVTEVVGYEDRSHNSYFGVFDPGGINTLFSMDNYMYQSGMLNPFTTSFMGVGYEVALGFIETMDKYHPDKYNFRYHRHSNQLEIYPVPCGNQFTYTVETSASPGSPPVSASPCNPDSKTYKEITIDSPGYVLVKAMMIEGSTLPTYVPSPSSCSPSASPNPIDNDWDTPGSQYDIGNNYSEWLYDNDWIQEYSLAWVKANGLGRTRSKLQNMTVLGNAGIPLDGDTILQEGREDIDKLMEKLDSEESYEGFGIMMGAC